MIRDDLMRSMAQEEIPSPVTTEDCHEDFRDLKDTVVEEGSKYLRKLRGGIYVPPRPYSCPELCIDVYDVLDAFNVTNPALQHCIKKLLCLGLRGHKDAKKDLEEAIEALSKAEKYI